MRSTNVCHAAADTHVSQELIRYLAVNCPTQMTARVIGAGEHLLDAVEDELPADFVFILLSPDSAGSAPWKRERWEDVLVTQAREVKTKIAYLLLEGCKFPDLLRRNNFFDLSHDLCNGRLEVRRWLLSELLPSRAAPKLPSGDVPRTSPAAAQKLEQLLEAPGALYEMRRGDALRFARKHWMDFEAAAWIDCSYRSTAGIFGDIAQALNIPLAGTADQNAAALREYCEQNRVLLVFENAGIDQLGAAGFGGKASLVFAKPAATVTPQPLVETLRMFSTWSSNSPECLATLRWAQFHVIQIEYASEDERRDLFSLGFAAVALLRENNRLAEAQEFLGWMGTAAFLHPTNSAFLARCQWESSWIREAWDLPASLPAQLPPPAAEPTQLGFSFGE